MKFWTGQRTFSKINFTHSEYKQIFFNYKELVNLLWRLSEYLLISSGIRWLLLPCRTTTARCVLQFPGPRNGGIAVKERYQAGND